MIIIAQKYGLPAVYGAMLCSGVFGLLIAKPFSMMIRFFPPLVAGTVICVIGLSLIGADVSLIAGDNPAAKDYGQVSHIALAGLVMLLIVVITRCFRGFISQIAVLLSIAIGTLVAWPMHLLNFSSASAAKWVGFSGFFRFGHPKFEAAAIISMCIVMLVTYTESTADMLAVSEMVDKKLSPSDLARGLATDGLSAVLAGFLNSFPDTAFAENVGLVGLTRVRSRWVVTTCGTMLILLGLLPKIGQVVASVPGPVIGGAATVMFAMVTAVGIQTLHKVNFEGNNNLLIVAVSLAAGLLPAVAPSFYEHFPSNFQVIFGSSITSTVIVVFTLNMVFNHWSWRRQGTESAVEVAVREGAVAVNVPDDGVRGGDKVNVPATQPTAEICSSDPETGGQEARVMSYGSARALGGDGLGDLAGGALERGHDASRGVVGHPRLRAGGGDGQRARRVRHGHREAAHADLLLALVDGVPLLADHLEVREQQVRVGDRGGRVGGHAVPLEQRARLPGRKLRRAGPCRPRCSAAGPGGPVR